jgi:hypothetical protein
MEDEEKSVAGALDHLVHLRTTKDVGKLIDDL